MSPGLAPTNYTPARRLYWLTVGRLEVQQVAIPSGTQRARLADRHEHLIRSDLQARPLPAHTSAELLEHSSTMRNDCQRCAVLCGQNPASIARWPDPPGRPMTVKPQLTLGVLVRAGGRLLLATLPRVPHAGTDTQPDGPIERDEPEDYVDRAHRSHPYLVHLAVGLA